MSGLYVIKDGTQFWRANRRGYTTDLLDAGVYSEAEALSIQGHGKDPQNRAIPLERLCDELAQLQRTAALRYGRAGLFLRAIQVEDPGALVALQEEP